MMITRVCAYVADTDFANYFVTYGYLYHQVRKVTSVNDVPL